MTIVCVGDEATRQMLSAPASRGNGREPETACFAGADEALGWLKSNRADAAVLDLGLSAPDALTLALRIREIRPDIGIFFVSGKTGYQLKPVDAGLLAAGLAETEYDGLPRKKTAHVTVLTFGEFDVLADGIPVVFARARAKELLAYLIDRHGGSVTRANAFAALWEGRLYDRAMQKQLDVVIRSLRSTLEKYGIGDIMELRKGSLRAVPEKLDCDLYRFMDGEPDAAESYRGEYMNAYSWASNTEAYLDRIRRK